MPGALKTTLATAASVALLWKPTVVAMFPGFLYTTDLSAVFLPDGCIGSTSQTVFVFCLIEVLAACVLLKDHVLPVAFGLERWGSYDNLKQQKLVGFIIKILVRMSCAVQIIVLVSPEFNMENGLFARFNMKEANARLVKHGQVTTCKEAGMGLRDAAALRAWIFARDDMMAVMVWELAFIPGLPLDAWLHHLFVILGVALGSDPQLLGSRAKIQPLIDGISFFLVLGATLAAAVEAAVLMYHFSAPDAARQAKWMMTSMVVQALLVLILFAGFPLALVFMHLECLGYFQSTGIVVLIGLLAAVEVKMIIVKLAIFRNARRKTQVQRQLVEVAEAPQAFLDASPTAPGGSFNHDISRDAALLCQEGLGGRQASHTSEMAATANA